MYITWTYIYSFLLGLIVLGLICVILLENRSPHKALSWVLVLTLLPGLGIILYLLFGRKNWKIRRIRRHADERFDLSDTPHVHRQEEDERGLGKYRLLRDMVELETNAQVIKADEVTIFRSGIDKMASLLEDIKGAKYFVHVEYYIFMDDATGQSLADALIQKASEGVKVRVICDYVGSFKAKRSFFARMVDAGIEFRQFLKVVFPSLRSDINYRNHRKVVVIDRNIGYIGGMNVADHYTVGSGKGCWMDTHFRVTGSAVNGLQASFMGDWRFAGKIALSLNYFIHPQEEIPAPTPNLSPGYINSEKVYNVKLQTFSSGPTSKFRTLMQAWNRSIYEAKSHIYIETPYFLPTESLNKALIGAALSGVRVYLVIPWKSDTPAVKYASESYYADLMEAGVRIYRYNDNFNHSKLMTIDGEIAYIGSANMDFRSMEYNFEITSIVYDKYLTRAIEAHIIRDIEDKCEQVLLHRWEKRGLLLRLAQSFFRLFSPLM